VHGGIAANLLGIVPHAQAERESYSMISFILRNHLLVSYFVGHHKDALEVLGLIDCAGVYGCAHSLDRGHAHHLTIGLALFIGPISSKENRWWGIGDWLKCRRY